VAQHEDGEAHDCERKEQRHREVEQVHRVELAQERSSGEDDEERRQREQCALHPTGADPERCVIGPHPRRDEAVHQPGDNERERDHAELPQHRSLLQVGDDISDQGRQRELRHRSSRR
jgi:hypothetical protein